MCPIALGRKNWMDPGSCQESGPRVAAIMTVIASAQRCGHNVRDDTRQRPAATHSLKLTTESLPPCCPLLPKHWQAAAPAAPTAPADPGIAVACPGTIEVPAHG